MARPLGEVRPPGVYISHADIFPRVVSLTDTRTAGFVGLSVKGPLHEPVRINSWDEFVEAFGDGDIGYLARAVEGFFVNGGSRCYVVRVAHRARGETKPGPEHAYSAERIIRDGWDKPTLAVRAQSEGRGGKDGGGASPPPGGTRGPPPPRLGGAPRGAPRHPPAGVGARRAAPHLRPAGAELRLPAGNRRRGVPRVAGAAVNPPLPRRRP